MITISYWRSAGHLHAFARGAAHRKGWDWFQRSTKQHPHLGIMHELYSVPAGHWENTYLNFNPFCMGEPFLSSLLGESLFSFLPLLSLSRRALGAMHTAQNPRHLFPPYPLAYSQANLLLFSPAGRTQHVVPSEDDVASQLRSNLIPANGSRWKSMHLRMGHATDPEAKSE